jgi:hypothetical protein
MRSVRLGRQFDAVFVQDAVGYLTTEVDLKQAIETASIHCRVGGVVLFAPDYTKENFRAAVDHGGSDAADRGVRFFEWAWDPESTRA